MTKHHTDSKEKMQTAFLELYAEKPLGSITVKEITAKAGVNRSTFYLYYNDIYTIYEDVEKTLIDNILPNIDIFLGFLDHQNDLSPLIEKLKFYQENYPYVKSFLTVNNTFTRKIKDAIKKKVMLHLNLEKNDINDFITEYIVSAHFGILSYYLSGKNELSIDEMIRLLSEIFLNGPYKMLIRSNS